MLCKYSKMVVVVVGGGLWGLGHRSAILMFLLWSKRNNGLKNNIFVAGEERAAGVFDAVAAICFPGCSSVRQELRLGTPWS